MAGGTSTSKSSTVYIQEFKCSSTKPNMSKRKAEEINGSAESSDGAPLPPFERLRDHLTKLQKRGKLVDLLCKAWDADDMKRHIVSKLGGWAKVADSSEYLKYDWDIVDEDEHERDDDRGIKLHFASNDVRLGSYSRAKKVDAKECRHGGHSIYGGGCQECRGCEEYLFTMERRLDGATRLKVHSYVSCKCGGGRYEDSDHCEEEDYIAVLRGGKSFSGSKSN